MYQALYRKYRSRTLAEVLGQPHITRTLLSELAAGRFAHAYVFTGSRGTGKTSTARILAKAVNCLNPRNGDPCGKCESCRVIDNGDALDVVEIDAASNGGVDNIRDLRETIHFTPAVCKYRVYIIDEVHMLTGGAFAALLKTLEEPPPHAVFILATTEVHKLPATVLSRCQRFDFQRIDPEVIASHLLDVAGKEDISLEPDAAALIAELSDGGMRDALSLLEMCAPSALVTIEAVRDTAGLVGREPLLNLAEKIIDGDGGAALQALAELHGGSYDMERLCEALSAHFRDLMLIASLPQAQIHLTCTADEYVRMEAQARALTLPRILASMQTLRETAFAMRGGAQRRAELEVALIRLCTPELEPSLSPAPADDALARRVERLESQLAALSKSSAAPAASSQHPPVRPPRIPSNATDPPFEPAQRAAPDNPKPAESSEEPGIAAEPPRATAPIEPLVCWPQALEKLAARNPLIYAVLKDSKAYVQGDYLLLDAKSPHFREYVNAEQKHRADIRAVVAELTGAQYKLGPYTGPAQDSLDAFLGEMRERGADITVVD